MNTAQTTTADIQRSLVKNVAKRVLSEPTYHRAARLWRFGRWSLSHSLRISSTLLVRGLPDCAFGFDGGIGDNLLCSTVARELRKRGESRICMLTPYPQLFWR